MDDNAVFAMLILSALFAAAVFMAAVRVMG